MKTIIISLGGSIIAPDGIDTKFLKEFRKLILKVVKKNKVVIYCGGGSIARKYQEAYKKIRGANQEAMDWIGISATHLNAFLVRSIFYDIAENFIVENPTKKMNFRKKVLVSAGWKPGWSTDYDSVLLAKNIGANTIINLTNVDYVYNKNPKKFKNAKPIKEITWKDFKKLVGNKWSPGLHMPFDPIAAKEAMKNKFTVVIMNGRKIKNLENYFSKKQFKGTIIK